MSDTGETAVGAVFAVGVVHVGLDQVQELVDEDDHELEAGILQHEFDQVHRLVDPLPLLPLVADQALADARDDRQQALAGSP